MIWINLNRQTDIVTTGAPVRANKASIYIIYIYEEIFYYEKIKEKCIMHITFS